MITTVSFTEFRNKLTNYIDLLKNGGEVSIKDAKKGKELVVLVAKKEAEFDWDAHLKWMKDFKPFWTKADDKHLQKIRSVTRKRFKELNW